MTLNNIARKGHGVVVYDDFSFELYIVGNHLHRHIKWKIFFDLHIVQMFQVSFLGIFLFSGYEFGLFWPFQQKF